MKRMKKNFGMVTLVLCLCLLLSSNVFAAKAKINPDTRWAKCEYTYGVLFSNLSEKAKIISIKSSKPSVIRADKLGSGINDTNLTPLKPGKSKITVKYKLGSKIYSVSATYTVKAYPSPYSSIKVNGAKINIKKNKYYYDVNNYKKTTAKVNFKLKKGWKIIDSYGYDQNGNNIFTPKNGENFKVPKGKDVYVFFDITNGKDVIQYGIRFIR